MYVVMMMLVQTVKLTVNKHLIVLVTLRCQKDKTLCAVYRGQW